MVAPAAVDFADAADFDTVRGVRHPAVRLCASRRGTWHWGPYPVGAPHVRIFNIQGRGYPDDNGVAHFVRDHGLAYVVKTKLD